MRDGRAVAVKVQRPNIRELLADDIEFFRELARYLTEHTSAGERVDMIGIVQVGSQSMADRYTYVPLIGPFIMIAWEVPARLAEWIPRREARSRLQS